MSHELSSFASTMNQLQDANGDNVATDCFFFFEMVAPMLKLLSILSLLNLISSSFEMGKQSKSSTLPHVTLHNESM